MSTYIKTVSSDTEIEVYPRPGNDAHLSIETNDADEYALAWLNKEQVTDLRDALNKWLSTQT
jgi:hypothetical protein